MGEDPVVPVVALVVILLIILLFIRIFRYCVYERGCGPREDDVEGLDPSIEFRGPSFLSSVFCCSETVREETWEENQQELSVSPERSRGVVVGPALAVPGASIENGNEQQSQASTNPKPKPIVRRSGPPVANNEVQLNINQLQILQTVTSSKSDRLEIIRQAQKSLLNDESPTEEKLQTALIIGVDATPKVAGGYCVNLHDMSLDYYVIRLDEQFPWPLQYENNPSEFEMKNLIFALATWSKKIRRYKTFRIYTDNPTFGNANSEYGDDASDLVDHFKNCEDAKLVNTNVYINRREELGKFAKYIQPADDFSRWEIDKRVNFLCGLYGIQRRNVRGTLKLTRRAIPEQDVKAWYDPSPAYSQYITRARAFASNFGCENCMIIMFQLSAVPNNSNGRRGRRNKKLQQ